MLWLELRSLHMTSCFHQVGRSRVDASMEENSWMKVSVSYVLANNGGFWICPVGPPRTLLMWKLWKPDASALVQPQ